MTFHKLVKKIYEECLHQRCNSNIATPEEIQRCIDLVRTGKLSLRFKAIFIDEVQIFDPKYLELCYLLLEDADDNTFLMVGDLNQTVRKKSRRGDVPWKKIAGIQLDYTGRVRYIKKNYRNSKEIGKYLCHMLEHMNDRMKMLDMINFKEFEYDSFEISDKNSLALKVKMGIDRFNIKDETVNAIKEIVTQYRISYSEIAILFPYKQRRQIKYHYLYWLEQALNDADIPYSLITSSLTGSFDRKLSSQACLKYQNALREYENEISRFHNGIKQIEYKDFVRKAFYYMNKTFQTKLDGQSRNITGWRLFQIMIKCRTFMMISSKMK